MTAARSASQPAAGPSTTQDAASSGTGGTTDIHSVRCSGFGGAASRLQRLPSAQPSAPASVSSTGTQRRGLRAGDRDGGEAEHRQPDPDALPHGEPLTQQDRAEDHRERGRRLQHQRREPGGHADVHRDEQEQELQRAEPQPVAEQPAQPHLRARDEQHGGQRDDGEPQRGEEQGREVLQADVDGQEVRTPQHGDEGGEQAVAGRHASTVTPRHPEDQRTDLHCLCSVASWMWGGCGCSASWRTGDR